MLPAAVLPVLERHLERDLDRGRPRVRVEDPVQARGRDVNEAIGQLCCARVGETQHGRVGDAVELLADPFVDRRMPVPVDVAPEGGDAVQIAATLGVDELGPLGGLDHQRLLLHPITLLREWMPEMIVIEPGSFLHRRGPTYGGRRMDWHACAEHTM